MPRPRKITPLPPRKHAHRRAENQSLWKVNDPLQKMILAELDRREWSISDLGRAIRSQPSLVSRWMQGQRPSPESLDRIASVLDLDLHKMMVHAGHLPPEMLGADEDEDLARMFTTMRKITWNEERRDMLFTLLAWMRENEPATAPDVNPAHEEPPLEQTG